MNLLFILIALLVLGVIVLAHELGHYVAGRLTGIGIEEFAIGMGPKIFSITRKGIRYSLRLLPIGGFCRFVGEDEENPAQNAMHNQAVWKRLVTIFSGPLLNFILAFLAMFVFLQLSGFYGIIPNIEQVEPGSPAAIAGFMPGDTVIEVDGIAITYDDGGVAKTTELIRGYRGEGLMQFTVLRDDETVGLSVVPALTEGGVFQIGIVYGVERVYISPIRSVGFAIERIFGIFAEMIDGLRGLIFHGEGVEEAMGPLGIVTFVAQEARHGINTILLLTVLISMNLGIVNLLPIPALDGGRILFLIVEGVRGKPISAEYEGRIHLAGFALLIGIIIFFSYRDILRLFAG